MSLATEGVEIGGRVVGPGRGCFVIAEAGVNHNGSLETARRLADVAFGVGADAVKYQTFTAERLVTPAAPKAKYQRKALRDGESQLEMLRGLELPPPAFRELKAHCDRRGILFLSTPFDEENADFLLSLDVPAFKIASGEITNLPLVKHIALTGRPMIISTGMANLEEVEAAVRVAREEGNDRIMLLHCVSDYPADPADANLRAMGTLARAFEVPVGYSDHTLGVEVSLAAVALGACVIEKHFTLDRSMPGPDHRASLEPQDLAALVRGIRTVEAALGHGRKEPSPRELETAAVARKSLVAAVDIPAGAILTEELVAVRRPGTGLPPRARSNVIGRTARRDIPAGTLLTLEMLA